MNEKVLDELYKIANDKGWKVDSIDNIIDKINTCKQHYDAIILSEDFIREFKDKLDLKSIQRGGYQPLSEDFIREFKNKVNWDYISSSQTLSKDFIREFIDKLSIRCLNNNRNIIPSSFMTAELLRYATPSRVRKEIIIKSKSLFRIYITKNIKLYYRINCTDHLLYTVYSDITNRYMPNIYNIANDSNILNDIMDRIKLNSFDIVLDSYKFSSTTILGIIRKHIHDIIEEVVYPLLGDIVIEADKIEKSVKYLLPVYNMITKTPIVYTRNTIDNKTEYFNIVNVEVPMFSNNFNYEKTVKSIKEYRKELLQYISWYLAVNNRKIYEMRKFLKLDYIQLLEDYTMKVQYSIKGDNKASV